jgi:hypothetical protein
VVAAEEQEVGVMQQRTQAMAEEAKADLAEALPALQAAIDSLKALNKNDITEVGVFGASQSVHATVAGWYLPSAVCLRRVIACPARHCLTSSAPSSAALQMKSFTKPPALVQMTMEAVCILKQEKADWDSVRGTQTLVRKSGSLKGAADGRYQGLCLNVAMAHPTRSLSADVVDPCGFCCRHAGQACAVGHELHAKLGGVRQG